MSDYLFAYGTLQPGCASGGIAHVAARLRPVGRGFVHGVLYELEGYPGAVPDPRSKQKIAGTVMELPEDADVLRELDEYEGFDPQAPERSEYTRVRQTIEMNEGGTMECWMYRYNRATGDSR